MIYVTADIHGKNEMLMQLLEKAGFREDIFSLGKRII
jgi:hypothetical protein